MTTAPLVFNRRAASPSGIGTTLQWGDLGQFTETATLEFVARGSCHGMAANVFFPERGGDVHIPRAICESCPVMVECLAWALAHERTGMWGGRSEKQRKALRRRLGMSVQRPETTPMPECGSPAAYQAHRKRGEDPCQRCRMAHTASEMDRRARAS